MPQCVAKLAFEPLPWRLVNLLGDWDETLDPFRSTPWRLLLAAEVLGLCAVCIMLARIVMLALELGRNLVKGDRTGDENMNVLLQEDLPKSVRLAAPANVYAEPCGDLLPDCLDPRESQRSVVVKEMRRCSGARARLQHFLDVATYGLSKKEAVWGRLEDPEGWIVLLDAEFCGVLGTKADPAPFYHPDLLLPVGILLQRQIILAASHVSAQWMLLTQAARFVKMPIVILLSLTAFFMHVIVLERQERLIRLGAQYNEVLERQTKRLQIPEGGHFFNLAILLAFMSVLSLLGGDGSFRVCGLGFWDQTALEEHSEGSHVDAALLCEGNEPQCVLFFGLFFSPRSLSHTLALSLSLSLSFSFFLSISLSLSLSLSLSTFSVFCDVMF